MTAHAFNAFLSGGPADIPQWQRLVRLDAVNIDEDIVVQKGNGYEHFGPTEEFCEVEGSRLAVFRWQYQTKIAE